MTYLTYNLGFTGHRPDKLGGYSDAAQTRVDDFANWWLKEWARLNPQLLPHCHVGMAQGWDQAIAYACICLGYRFTAHLPASGAEAQRSRWPDKAQFRHEQLMAFATWTEHGPAASSFAGELNARNGSIIAASDTVYALWNGSPGGTGNCVRDAEKAGKSVINVWPTWEGWRR